MAVMQPPKVTKGGKVQKRKRKHAEVPAQPTVSPAGGDDDDFPDVPVNHDTAANAAAGAEAEAAANAPAEVKKAEVAKLSANQRKKARTERLKKYPDFKEYQAVTAQIATSNAQAQAEWLWQNHDRIAGASFLEKEAFTGEAMVRLSGEGSLEDQLKAAVPDWQQTLCGSHQQGHARCLIVSAGAVSALDMMKQLPNFNEACRIAKLFAKHKKLKQQQQYLKEEPVCIAAGTPHRLLKLADSEALQLKDLKLIIIDVHQDAKQRYCGDG